MFKKLADFFRAYGYHVSESRAAADSVPEQNETEMFILFDQLNRNS